MPTFALPQQLHPKALRWIRALDRRAHDAWWATIEDLEAFAIEAAFAVIAVRVLEESVFEAADEATYVAYRRSVIEGGVVQGLQLIRNAEIHAPTVIEYDNKRLVSVPFADGQARMRFFPRWKPFDQLPVEYRQRAPTGGRADPECQDAYRRNVAGRLVMETLLDAIAFFQGAEPSLTARSFMLTGEPVFPLPNLACRPDERLAPDWPSAERWYEGETRRIKADALPAAPSREVTVQLWDEKGRRVGFGGWAPADSTLATRESWVERSTVVERDVRHGYRYLIRSGDSDLPIKSPRRGELEARLPDGSNALDAIPLGTEMPVCLDWLRFLEDNEDLYREMRLAR